MIILMLYFQMMSTTSCCVDLGFLLRYVTIHTVYYLIIFQSEVRLARDHDVFISKAQLDSILVNYTRSGSLLFRKLVRK